MCWSGEASTVVATVGIVCTVYAAYKKQPTPLWLCLGYFSLMEALQAYTYSVIGDCTDPSNQIATLLGYLHITFQPFFINAVSLHFIEEKWAKKVAPFAYTVCFVAAIMMLIKLYPFEWAAPCLPNRPMCGEVLCAIHGNWHIAWSVPVNGIGDRFSWYFFAAFFVPLLYGSWRFTIYHFFAGPLLSYATTQNMNEWPAVWCLFSFAFCFIAFETPLRKMMYVRYTWLDKFLAKVKQ
jgi:Family of unknown function (DUF5765)